eukprot:COSAG02_NODE_535_length_20660_cov_37.561111_2_plen_95_part_00
MSNSSSRVRTRWPMLILLAQRCGLEKMNVGVTFATSGLTRNVAGGSIVQLRVLRVAPDSLAYVVGKGSLRRFRSRSFISAWASFALAAAKRSLA